MGVSRRPRVPERITKPDERFNSSQVGQALLYYKPLRWWFIFRQPFQKRDAF